MLKQGYYSIMESLIRHGWWKACHLFGLTRLLLASLHFFVFALEVMSMIVWWLDSPFVFFLYLFAVDFICEIAIHDWANWTRYILYMMGLYIAAREKKVPELMIVCECMVVIKESHTHTTTFFPSRRFSRRPECCNFERLYSCEYFIVSFEF